MHFRSSYATYIGADESYAVRPTPSTGFCKLTELTRWQLAHTSLAAYDALGGLRRGRRLPAGITICQLITALHNCWTARVLVPPNVAACAPKHFDVLINRLETQGTLLCTDSP